jgi:hypothetical protein
MSFDELRRIALDRAEPDESRSAAIERLVALKTSEAAQVVVELGSSPDEREAIQRAAGAAIGDLVALRLVSEWDLRNLTQIAATALCE